MSESTEMYLVTIGQLLESGHQEPLPLSLLAEELSINSVSANEMVHKLEERGLVTYTPYKGVFLSSEGRERTDGILRKRRLWQSFLERCLDLGADDAEALACRMEHITPDNVADRLGLFLYEDQLCPIEDFITAKGSEPLVKLQTSLDGLKLGQRGRLLEIQDAGIDSIFAAEQLAPGAELEVKAIGSNDTILLGHTQGTIHMLRQDAQQVLVEVLYD
ncbi:MAG: metal-dependent transcriptional regulator [Chloroflexi bacterium]|nr:MAG: metal-dependent transcriptional regulator [Chloroflexota bacterium]MBL1194880.1 metal-dependent transcriptional regulator [Chloroflexota bacterium]NOH12171.1 metal-dependent transcriptional regulator [Chloroflexota bacterium]